MSAQSVYRTIRSLAKYYPTRRLTTNFSALISKVFPVEEPLWLIGEPCGPAPRMELNLSCPHQTRAYLFPRGYCNNKMQNPLPQFMARTLEAGGLFLDIGAHLGLFSLYAARLVGPLGRVISFEPNPDIYDSLVCSSQLNSPDTMTSVQLALSDSNGETEFFRARKPAASSLVPEEEGREDRYVDSFPVQCQRLDDYVRDNHVDVRRLQLIKCDVEGHEPQVVAGMTATLERTSFPPLWIEVRGPQGSTRAPGTYPKVQATLGELGYRPYMWSGAKASPVSEGDIVGREDVLFQHEFSMAKGRKG